MRTAGGDGAEPAGPLDLDALMREVEAEAVALRASGRLAVDPADAPLAASSPIDRLGDTWEVVGRRETLAGPLPLEVARRAVVKAASPFTTDLVVQVNRFHLAAADAIRDLAGQLAEERAARADLEARVAILERELAARGGAAPNA